MGKKEEFLQYVDSATNGKRAPLRGFSKDAKLIDALLDAFNKFEKPDLAMTVQNFDDPAFDVQCVVYIIRNVKNDRVYIGRTSQTFRQRYADCHWWKEHHNHELDRDVEIYGIGNFWVKIYACPNDSEAALKESQLITSNAHKTYNVRPEPISR